MSTKGGWGVDPAAARGLRLTGDGKHPLPIETHELAAGAAVDDLSHHHLLAIRRGRRS